jgi:adenylyltransferase/sulfurtransferase
MTDAVHPVGFTIAEAQILPTAERLSREIIAEHPEIGGVVTFEGRVRNHHQGRTVTALEYSVYRDLAMREGERIVRETAERLQLPVAVAIHRVGAVPIGEMAVWIYVGGAHRSNGTFRSGNTSGTETAVMNGSLATRNRVDTAYFQRQMQLPAIGYAGQARLADAHVAVVGLGALGSPAVTYLARAGVGRLTLCDGDEVAYHNLHRQTLFSREDVGRPKAEVVAEVLRREYPSLEFAVEARYFSEAPGGGDAPRDPEAPRSPVAPTTTLLSRDDPPDLLLDCTDRFSSRFAVHDAGHRLGVNVVSAAVAGFTGQLHVYPFALGRSPCLRCLYPEGLTDGCTGSCAVDGILGAVTGTMGSWQALTAVRMLVGEQPVPSATTYTIELTTMEIMTTAWDSDPSCPLCGNSAEAPRVLPTTAEANPGSPAPLPPTRAIDLRRKEEIDAMDRALLPGVEHMPLDRFFSSMDDLDREASYLLVCEHGTRSAMARDAMVAAGFQNVAHLAGGYAALRAMVQ